MSISPWEVCPDCGCDRGQDHKRNCPRGRWTIVPVARGMPLDPSQDIGDPSGGCGMAVTNRLAMRAAEAQYVREQEME